MRQFVITSLLLIGAVCARAEVLTIEVDSAKSRISFSLGATLHTVKGTIPVSGGSVKLNMATGEASGTITAATSRAATGNDKRDADMHSKVLESVRFPSAQFTFDKVEGTLKSEGKSAVTARGRMSVHGAGHPMNVPGTLLIDGDVATADATFQIPYVQWGMKDPSKALIRVDKFVKVTLHLVGTVKR